MTAAPLFRLEREARLAAARKWIGARVIVEVGRDPDPIYWHRYSPATVVAVAIPMSGTVADYLILRRDDGRAWVTSPSNRQTGDVETDTLAISLAGVRAIRLAAV